MELHKQNPPVLNWFSSNESFTKGLKLRMKRRRPFVTMRLGPKWADALNPGQKVAISISDDESKPNIIGYVMVVETKKVQVSDLASSDLKLNIGARTRTEVVIAMTEVYGQMGEKPVSVLKLEYVPQWNS